MTTASGRNSVHWSERLRDRLAVIIEPGRRSVLLSSDGRPFLRVTESLEIEDLAPGPWLSSDEKAEIRGGPGVLVAMALAGRFCLHASAVRFGEEAVLFLGDSGAGKSTLAREIGRGRPGASRLTDDLSPVELSARGLLLFPAFPQLKLAPEEQWGGGAGESIKVRKLLVLAPKVRGPLVAEPLDLRETMLALVQHTAAARLFDAGLLARHFEFAGSAAGCVEAFRLGYPHRSAAPAEVAGWLEKQSSQSFE